LSVRQDEVAVSFAWKDVDPRHAIEDTPFLCQPEQTAQRRKRPVDRCGTDLPTSVLHKVLDKRLVDLGQARRRQRLKVEQSGKLLGVKLDGSRFCSTTYLDRVDEALRKVSKLWRRLALGDPNLTLSESRAVGRLYLTGDSGVPLLRGLLDMFSVKDEVIPVNSTPFEYRHPYPLSPFALAPGKGKAPSAIRLHIVASPER